MSVAEIVAATVAAFLAAVPIVAYLIDAAGLGLMPGVVLAASIAIAAAIAWSLRVGVKPGWFDLLAWSGVVGAVLAWLLRIAPSSVRSWTRCRARSM